MSARVELELRAAADSLTVPGDAIHTDPKTGETYVMIALGNQAQRKAVQIGLDDGIRVEVTAGLTGTEQVILGRPAGLQDGDPIVARPKTGAGQ